MTADQTGRPTGRPASPAPGRIVLLRHGETEWSATGRHTGVTDIPLTAKGEAAAGQLREQLTGHELALVLTSPLSRAAHTARLAGLRVGGVDEDLREWDYGGYEGRTTAEIREELGYPWTVFADGVVPGETPGETVEEVAARASRVLERIRPHLDEGDVALVGHGHALRVLAAVYLRQEPRFGANLVLGAGSVCILGHHHEDPVIEVWNRTVDQP